METCGRLTLFEADFAIYLTAFWRQAGIQRVPTDPGIHKVVAEIFEANCEMLEDYFDVRFSAVDDLFSSIVTSALGHYRSPGDMYIHLDISYGDAVSLLGSLKGGGRELMDDIATRIVAYFPAWHTYRKILAN